MGTTSGTKFIAAAIFCVLLIQDMSAQDTLSVLTDKKYECGSSVQLRCAPAGCCVGTITWRKDGTQIMSAGNPTIPGKYTQTTVTGSHFDFTIEDLALTDLDSTYVCVFAGTPSNDVKLNADDYYCPPCGSCGGICFAYSLVGVVIAVVIAIVVPMCLDPLKEKAKIITGISIGVGLVLDIVVSVPVGITTCLCEQGYGYTCIFIGVVAIIVVLIVILVFYLKNQKGRWK